MNPIIDYCSVFSAHAEVVPRFMAVGPRRASILRARGGSSWAEVCGLEIARYSPRTRR